MHQRKAFSCWRLVNYNTVTAEMFTSIKHFEESKVTHQKEISRLHKDKAIKAIQVMDLKRKGEIFSQWREDSRFKAILKQKIKIFEEKTQKSAKIKRALLNWRSRVQVTKTLRKKLNNLDSTKTKEMSKKVFEGWKQANFVQKNL